MNTSDSEPSHLEAHEIHDRIILNAELREQFLGSVDLAKVSRIASEAYWTAKRNKESLSVAEQRALHALTHCDSDVEHMQKLAASEFDDWSHEIVLEPKTTFVLDFLFAGILPILLVIVFVSGGTLALGLRASLTAFGLLSLVAFLQVFLPRHFHLRWSWASTALLQSGGAIAAGFFVVLVTLSDRHHRDNVHQLEMALEELNRAAAVAVAACKVGAPIQFTRDVLVKTTSAKFQAIECSGSRGVYLSASLPRDGTWTLRTVSQGPSDSRPTTTAYLKLNNRQYSPSAIVGSLFNDDRSSDGFLFIKGSDQEKPYARYIYGSVTKADFGAITLKTDDSQLRTIELPNNILAPALNSQIVAVLPNGTNIAASLEPVSSTISSLTAATD